MIDVIIPAYNAHETIIRTLSSLALQTIRDKLIIHIIDDASTISYEKECSMYLNYLNIKLYKLLENSGPGYARECGINNSIGEYITFIDADDTLYDYTSLEKLYNTIIDGNYDLVMSAVDINGQYKCNNCFGDLHGKIYSRKFIQDNDIHFNDTKYSEDNAFNQLAMNISYNCKITDEITYTYIYNNNSLTKGNVITTESLFYYIKNMIYVLEELEKRNVKLTRIIDLLIITYIYVYKNLKINGALDKNYIFDNCGALEKKFSDLKNNISDYYIFSRIARECGISNMFYDLVMSDFNQFRKKFKVDSND